MCGMLPTILFRVFCLPVSYLKIKIYKAIILPVILYGCETRFLTLGDEHTLRSAQKESAEDNIWA
jgi:hypothetical protein